LPNIALEAQACGTPVAAFSIGGLPDIIMHRETGWLATPFDSIELAEGILWILSDKDRHASLSASSRKKAVERYAESVIAAKYADLYLNLLAKDKLASAPDEIT
jgi:glycosyltransferase involved in cell wall biosynthesis